MHTIKDFAQLFNCTTTTIHTYLKSMKPLLTNFDTTKRKRMYTDEEAAAVIEFIKQKYPKRLKKIPKDLRQIFIESIAPPEKKP